MLVTFRIFEFFGVLFASQQHKYNAIEVVREGPKQALVNTQWDQL